MGNLYKVIDKPHLGHKKFFLGKVTPIKHKTYKHSKLIILYYLLIFGSAIIIITTYRKTG